MPIVEGVLPWQSGILEGWDIIGMNHYHVRGEKWLFVAMIKDDWYIKSEGRDDSFLWLNLALLARRKVEQEAIYKSRGHGGYEEG